MLVGVVDADQLNVYYDGTNTLVTNTINLIPNGPAVPLDVRITYSQNRTPPNNVHIFTYKVIQATGGSASDIIVTAVEGNNASNTAQPFPLYWTQDGGEGATEQIDITIASTGPIGANYSIVFLDFSTGDMVSLQVATIHSTNIPEFPTIALPVAGVIGLIYLLHFRRKKQ